MNIVREIYGIPIRFELFNNIKYQFENGIIVNGDVEIGIYPDGRVLLVWVTKDKIPDEVLSRNKFDFRKKDSPVNYFCEVLGFLTAFTTPELTSVTVFALSKFVGNFLPVGQRSGFDKVLLGCSNFFFGAKYVRTLTLELDDKDHLLSYNTTEELPRFEVELEGFKIQFHMTPVSALLQSLHVHSTAPIVATEIILPIGIPKEFERVFFSQICVGSGNQVIPSYKYVYKNEVEAQVEFLRRNFLLFNPFPLIKPGEDNWRDFLLSTFGRLKIISQMSDKIGGFSFEQWVQNIINTFIANSKTLKLLHIALSLEGIGRIIEQELKQQKNLREYYLFHREKQKSEKYELGFFIDYLITKYDLSVHLKKLYPFRTDFAHGIEKHKEEYDIEKDYLPIANDFRKALCKFLDFGGTPLLLTDKK